MALEAKEEASWELEVLEEVSRLNFSHRFTWRLEQIGERLFSLVLLGWMQVATGATVDTVEAFIPERRRKQPREVSPPPTSSSLSPGNCCVLRFFLSPLYKHSICIQNEKLAR